MRQPTFTSHHLIHSCRLGSGGRFRLRRSSFGRALRCPALQASIVPISRFNEVASAPALGMKLTMPVRFVRCIFGRKEQIPTAMALFDGIAKRVAQISSGNLSTAGWGKERVSLSSVKCRMWLDVVESQN